jgi:hypothetical protein
MLRGESVQTLEPPSILTKVLIETLTSGVRPAFVVVGDIAEPLPCSAVGLISSRDREYAPFSRFCANFDEAAHWRTVMPAPRVTRNSPWHIVFVLDDSDGMNGEPAKALNEAMEGMLEEMKLMSQGTKPYFKLSFIAFGSSVEVLAEAQTEQQADPLRIGRLAGGAAAET